MALLARPHSGCGRPVALLPSQWPLGPVRVPSTLQGPSLASAPPRLSGRPGWLSPHGQPGVGLNSVRHRLGLGDHVKSSGGPQGHCPSLEKADVDSVYPEPRSPQLPSSPPAAGGDRTSASPWLLGGPVGCALDPGARATAGQRPPCPPSPCPNHRPRCGGLESLSLTHSNEPERSLGRGERIRGRACVSRLPGHGGGREGGSLT